MADKTNWLKLVRFQFDGNLLNKEWLWLLKVEVLKLKLNVEGSNFYCFFLKESMLESNRVHLPVVQPD